MPHTTASVLTADYERVYENSEFSISLASDRDRLLFMHGDTQIVLPTKDGSFVARDLKLFVQALKSLGLTVHVQDNRNFEVETDEMTYTCSVYQTGEIAVTYEEREVKEITTVLINKAGIIWIIWVSTVIGFLVGVLLNDSGYVISAGIAIVIYAAMLTFFVLQLETKKIKL